MRNLAISLLFLTASAAAAQEPVVVLRNATVETLSAAGRIEGATVVLRGGKIEAVGKDVKVPDDATVIDAKGGTLIPGIIDPHYEVVITGAATDDGAPTPAAIRGGRGGRGVAPAAPAARGGFIRVADNFYPHDTAYKPLPRAGLTRLNLITNGVGQAAVVRVTPANPDQMLAQADGVAYAVVTNTSDSLDEIRTRLEAAATGRPRGPTRGGAGGGRGAGGRGARGGGGRGGDGGAAGSPTDADTRLWQQVHDGEKPLIASAASPAAVIQLMRALGPYENVKLVLNTTGDSVHETIDTLKRRKVCVVMRPNLDLVPNSRDRFNAAHLLHEAGIEVAFSMSVRTAGGGAAAALAAALGDAEPPAPPSAADQDFPLFPVAMLVKTGLPRTTALEALSKRPAAILGLDKTHGTIEPGKAADLLLYTGDPLDPSSRLRLTLIDGRTAYAN